MPIKLPDPDATALVLPQASRPTVSYTGGIAAAGQAEAGAGLARLGQGITNAANEFQDAQDRIAYTGAQSAFLQKKLDLDQQYQNDPDYKTAPQRYLSDLQAAGNELSGRIAGARMREAFNGSVLAITERGVNYQIANAHRRSVDADIGYLDNEAQSLPTKVQNAADEATRAALIDNFNQQVDARVHNGSLTEVQGFNIKRSTAKQVMGGLVTQMIDRDPWAASRLLRGGSVPQGMTGDIGAAIANVAERVPGVNTDTLARTANVENPRGVVGNGGGPFQFVPSTARQYGLDASTVNDPHLATIGAAQKQVDDRAALTSLLVRPPTEQEVDLAHFQGAGGAAALIQNPDMSISDALSLAYKGNKSAVDAVIQKNRLDPSAPASSLIDARAKAFNSAPGHAADGSGNDVNASVLNILSPAERVRFAELAETRARTQQAAEQADQNRAMILQEKQARDASQADMSRVIDLVTQPNSAVTARDIADPNGQFKNLSPHDRMSMIAFANATLHREDHDAATFGPGFSALFQAVHAPPQAAPPSTANVIPTPEADDSGIAPAEPAPFRVTDVTQLVPLVGPGKPLTLAGFKQLQNELESRKTPEGAVEGAQKAGFFNAAHVQISGHGLFGGQKDAIGETNFAQFQIAALNAYAEGRKEGKTPTQLLSKDSPDYIGKLIPQYTRSTAQMMRDMWTQNNPDGPADKAGDAGKASDKVDLSTPEGVRQAYAKGHFGVGPTAYQRAAAALISSGLAEAPAPSVPTRAQDVPTNE